MGRTQARILAVHPVCRRSAQPPLKDSGGGTGSLLLCVVGFGDILEPLGCRVVETMRAMRATDEKRQAQTKRAFMILSSMAQGLSLRRLGVQCLRQSLFCYIVILYHRVAACRKSELQGSSRDANPKPQTLSPKPQAINPKP